MDQKDFVLNADSVLVTTIWNGLMSDLSEKHLLSSREQISFSSPKFNEIQGTVKLSIFLYNITEEQVSRNMPPNTNLSEKFRNTSSFDLHYLVTPFTGNDKGDHELLGEIIHIILCNPLIDGVDSKSNMRLVTKIDSLSTDELSKLWIAIGIPLRLSLSLTVSHCGQTSDSEFKVTSNAIATQKSTLDSEEIIKRYKAVFKTFAEQSTGWKNRNMVLRQWLLQEFKKYTGMTVEDMQLELNSLGDKLEHHQSTTRFIKPLNQLIGYYKYQLDELKGMQKVSHKQTENLETITIWIQEVKSLIEMLSSYHLS